MILEYQLAFLPFLSSGLLHAKTFIVNKDESLPHAYKTITQACKFAKEGHAFLFSPELIANVLPH